MINTDIQLMGGGYVANISSCRGGTCFRLLHTPTGADILRTPRDAAHLKENVFLFGNPLLFPPNRILGGKFTFDGREYVFPLNEPATGCHVHGALYEQPFAIEELRQDYVRLSFHAKAGEYIHFPHAFTFVREYTLDEDGLKETDSITNQSEQRMPFFLAYHTTFRLAPFKDSRPEDARVRLALGREEMRTEKFIPTGEFRAPGAREAAFASGTYAPHGTHLSAFYECSDTMTLTDSASGASVCYEGDPQFPYRMLFASADGGFFVCEPQTTAIDCFHLPSDAREYGLVTVEPKETKIYQTRIYVQ